MITFEEFLTEEAQKRGVLPQQLLDAVAQYPRLAEQWQARYYAYLRQLELASLPEEEFLSYLLQELAEILDAGGVASEVAYWLHKIVSLRLQRREVHAEG